VRTPEEDPGLEWDVYAPVGPDAVIQGEEEAERRDCHDDDKARDDRRHCKGRQRGFEEE
jgi:hypothetical protein